jgi:hypothetical protein
VDGVKVVLAALAVYRVSTDLAWEAGPYEVFSRWRALVIQRYGPDDWRSEGVSCPICVSFWIALPAAFVWGPLHWLGIAGAASFLARVSKDGQ